MAVIPTTPKSQRQWLAEPIPANEAMGHGGELEAVDALWAAYMALNAVGSRGSGIESHLAWDDGPKAPMALTSAAARQALARIPGVGTAGAVKIWGTMCETASSARWCYDLWRKGEI